MESKVSAILLAAGLSLRMGEDKLLLQYRGKTLLQRAVDLLSCLPVYEKILVTTKARLREISLPQGVHTVINPKPEDGQSGSLRLGVSAATGNQYLFLTADQPLLTAEDLQPLLKGAYSNEDSIIFPVISGKPCTPILFPSCYREELLALSGDIGGRTVRDRHPQACFAAEPEHPENFTDIDSPEDYLNLVQGVECRA